MPHERLPFLFLPAILRSVGDYPLISDKPESTGEIRISWHPAFLEAMRLELEPHQNQLEFIDEYQLTSESLRVDLLIIKKPKDLVITKEHRRDLPGV
jgi:hypothetical protein